MEIKRMDIREFLEGGFLQEANRQFFHPLGLALEVVTPDGGGELEYRLGGIWDYRQDPEGMVFMDLSSDESGRKAKAVEEERLGHVEARLALLGAEIQPIGHVLQHDKPKA